MGRLDCKVALITGAGGGIGRAAAVRFHEEGAAVVLGDLNEETLAASTDALADGDRVRSRRANVSDESDVAGLVELAIESFGRLDVVFSNAGVGGAMGPITDVDVDHWDYTLAANLRACFLCIKHGARAMRAGSSGGSIVVDASVAGLVSGPVGQAYAAAKAAMINLTRSAAVELAPERIRVNVICPGMINTPMIQRGRPREEIATWLSGYQPLPISGEPEHVAAAALFLASDESEFITGETLVVDGGLMARGYGSPDERNRLIGVDHGSTGAKPELRRLERTK